MTITTENLDDMTDGYITAALWADCMPLCTCGYLEERTGGTVGREPMEDHAHECPANESGGLEHLSVSAEDWLYVRHLVAAFVAAAGEDLETFAALRSCDPSEGSVWSYIGHDLRLTSGGHGMGFWDRDPDVDKRERANAADLARYGAARHRLTALAGTRPFDRTGGGDVWQTDDEHAAFDTLPLDADPAPGDRWVCPLLTSAQRQCWIETGRVPAVEDTYSVGS